MTQSPFIISCISIIGPDDSLLFIEKNNPQIFDITLDSLVFCSLDFFPPKTQKANKNDRMLSLQCNDSKYLIWGYRSNLNYKIILVGSFTQNPPESFIKNTFITINNLLFDTLANPFYSFFSPITSKNFRENIKEICSKQYNMD